MSPAEGLSASGHACLTINGLPFAPCPSIEIPLVYQRIQESSAEGVATLRGSAKGSSQLAGRDAGACFLRTADQLHEFCPGSRILPKCTEHGAGYRLTILFLYTPHDHAKMTSLKDNPYPAGTEHRH